MSIRTARDTPELLLAERVDQLCDRFEAAWQAGKYPTIEDYLAEIVPEGRSLLVQELLLIDREYRRRESVGPSADAPAADAAGSVIGNAGRLCARCPNCRQPVETTTGTSFRRFTCAACGSSFDLVADQSTREEETLPRAIAQFELVRLLGSGRFGRVWLARDTQLAREVALKIPRSGQLDEEEAEQFLREARAAARLRHPHIASVHEIGRDGETLYIVYDYVRGQTLAQSLARQPPTPREAAEVCARLAETLQYAHNEGVVHRDLKPGNVMLDGEGQPHVLDFGLAKCDADVAVSADGQVLGTPAYMSPEQARGEASLIDGRTDVYALGVIHYEMLTGVRPFLGNVRMVLDQVLHEEPRAPRRLNDRVPRDLEMICLKAMAKEPSWRYASAGEMAADLRRFLRGEPVRARPLGVLARAWRWSRQRQRVTDAGIALVSLTSVQIAFALCGVVVFSLGLANRPVNYVAVMKLLGTVVFLYVPMLWLGKKTLERKLPAIWGGLFSQALTLAIATAHFVGVMHFYDETSGLVDPDDHLRHWIAYTMMATVGMFYQAVGLVAYYSNRDARLCVTGDARTCATGSASASDAARENID